MNQILSLVSRPKTFYEMVGQSKIISSIKKQISSGRMPRAWMFSGGVGSGKTTIARIISVSYQCKHSDDFGNPCSDCYDHRSDFSIHEINASEINGVQELAEIAKTSTYAPMLPSRKRVFILDEAQRISGAAQNLLLKHFEDPPRTTVWIVCTTEPTKILNTLRSRCVMYAMRPLDFDGIKNLTEGIVKQHKLVLVDDLEPLQEELFRASITSPRLILMALEKYISGVSAGESVQGQETSVNTLRICRAVVKGDIESLHKEVKLATFEDMRFIRASVAGYLKAILMKSNRKEETLIWAILQLNEASKADEGLQIPMTLAVLHQIASKFYTQH